MEGRERERERERERDKGGIVADVRFSIYTTLANDYSALDEVLTFVPSTDMKQTICRTVTIYDDREVEGAEFFRIHLSSDDTSVILRPDSADVTISEGDGNLN